MIEINPSAWRKPRPFAHQVEGVRALVENPAFFLGDAPRTCKSRQVVDAACVLHDAGEVDVVLVVSPVAGRAVWGDRDFGQIRLYSWKRARVHQFHAQPRDLWSDERPEMLWVVTNYDFIRSAEHLHGLCAQLRGKKTMLVLDESSAVGAYRNGARSSQQAEAAARLRLLARRCVMLNGTPGEPPKLWGQFNILDPAALKRYKSFTTFRYSYAEWSKEAKAVFVRGKRGPQVVHDQVGWKNLDRLSRILAPWCLRRERKDCPELRDIKRMYDVREVALERSTWRVYQQLKREALVELEGGGEYVSPNAAVRLMRLAQLTSGHLGGFESEAEHVPGAADVPYLAEDGVRKVRLDAERDISSEKLDWLVEHLRSGCDARNVIVWCRWTRERERLAEMLSRLPGFVVHQLHGRQKRQERRDAEMAFAEGEVRSGGHLRHAMLAQPQAGGIALDMSAASEVFRLSNDYSLKTLEQSDDRPLGPAQRSDTVVYTDILATGPAGERTVDHTIVAALREKRSVARMTVSQWRKELERE